MTFTKKKFLSFPIEQQHKKAVELLRVLYDAPKEGPSHHYNEMATWMEITPITDWTYEEISKRYHFHLKLANQSNKEHNLLPTIRKNDRSAPLRAPYPVDIYLDEIRSAHNVGSIIRTCEAFSLGTIHFSPNTPDNSHPQVQKTSMGAHLHTKHQKNARIDSLPRPLIALETSERSLPISDFIFPTCFTLALGNEEYGCSEELLKAADQIIEIPLQGRKNSLNVANAFSIAAYEIIKQQTNEAPHASNSQPLK